MSTPLTHWESEPVRVWEGVWGVREVVALDLVDSTNAWLRRRGQLPDWTVVIAEEQTAGKGRGGARWSSPRGGLWTSWTITPRSEGAVSLVPLRTGLAVAEAVGRRLGIEVRIKWPNDLWVGEAKLGGILCERFGAGGVIVGLGLNLRPLPATAETRHPTVDLATAAHRPVSRAGLLGAILGAAKAGLERGGPRLRESERTALRDRDLLAGRRVRVRPGPEGVARGIDDRGRLRIESEEGVVPVSSGSIDLVEQGDAG